MVSPTPAQQEVAERTLALVADRLGCQLPYGRVDLIAGAESEPLVLEVELIDPYLSLDMNPRAARRLATALLQSGG